jgi:hypothetical protein
MTKGVTSKNRRDKF